jgi:hypothetical protein
MTELFAMGVLWHIGCDEGVPDVRTAGGGPDCEEDEVRCFHLHPVAPCSAMQARTVRPPSADLPCTRR